MKLEITLTSPKRRITKTLSVRTLVSVTVLSSLFMLVSSRSTDSVLEDFGRVKVAQAEYDAKQDEVKALADSTKIQLQQLIRQLAELDARLYEIDQRGDEIAKELGMKTEDLDVFDAKSAAIDAEDESIMKHIAAVQSSLKAKSQQLSVLESLVKGHNIELQAQVSGRPVNSGWLSSYYGMRSDPFTGNPAMHKGIDFAGKIGDDVVATGAGIITWSGDRYGYGLMIEIDHGNGLLSRYGHNKSLEVSVGEVVTKGQRVAIMGSTGRSTGAHVHYEVLKNGKQIDPLPYVYKSTSR